MPIFEMLFRLIRAVVTGIWRAINVKRQGEGDRHSATEYADAFLFDDKDRTDSDSGNRP